MKNRQISGFILFAVFFLALTMLSAFPALADGDLQKYPSCSYCGMDRTKFAHSRSYIIYDDDTSVGTCSLHCAAIDLSLKIDKIPRTITVGDYNTKKLIDAEKAFWVIGGSKMGVMTKRAKWAFAIQADARSFIKAFGGQAADYSQSIKTAFEDMYEDLVMIRNKRQKMKKKKADPPAPASPMPDDKCPVCGMFVAKYPDWMAQIRFKGQKTVFFDGAKDFFKYYFNIADYSPGKTTADIEAIFVTDYYSVDFVNAAGAHFVTGSDVFGPMGRELIPFSSAESAEAFLKDHRGKKIFTFDAITPEMLRPLK